MPLRFALLDAPLPLGVGPTGVERADALRGAGLGGGPRAEDGSAAPVPPHDSPRDPDTLLLNPLATREFSRRLADALGGILDQGRFSIVLGGECNIIVGSRRVRRRRGRRGLIPPGQIRGRQPP